jgi:hypothetical protein
MNGAHTCSPGLAGRAPHRAPRDGALDIVKGVLVIVMVIYHAMNVFSNAGAEAYGYIRFVSGSFVFVSGYIIARFYASGYVDGYPLATRRLLTRGVKLVLLFTAINLVINATGFGNPAKDQGGLTHFIWNSPAIYLAGDPRVASFQILLPIAYTLILAPLLLGALARWPALFLLLAVAGTLLYSLSTLRAPNLEFTLIGVAGLAVGLWESVRQRNVLRVGPLAAVVGISTLLMLMGHLSRATITYTVAIAILLKLLYDLFKVADASTRPMRYVALLGSYSLFAYIAQIVMLQGAQRVLRIPKLDVGVELAGVVVIASLALIVCCALLAELRKRVRWIDTAYRQVFA